MISLKDNKRHQVLSYALVWLVLIATPLWAQEDPAGPAARVDIKGEPQVKRDAGPVQLTFSAEGLLPGYRVCLDEYVWGCDRRFSCGLEQEASPEPHLLAPQEKPDGSVAITVFFPRGAAADWSMLPMATGIAAEGPVWRLLYIVNPDGSRSRILRWDAADSTLQRIDEFTESLPAVMEEQVEVPGVEGYSLDRAGAELFEQGLIPIVVHPESLRPLPSADFTKPWLERQIVRRQGVAAKQTVRRWSVVLLSISPAGRPEAPIEWPPLPEDEGSPADGTGSKPMDGGPPSDDGQLSSTPPPDVAPSGGLQGGVPDNPANPNGGLASNGNGPIDQGQPSAQPGIDIPPPTAGQGPDGGLNGSVGSPPMSNPDGGLIENPTIPSQNGGTGGTPPNGNMGWPPLPPNPPGTPPTNPPGNPPVNPPGNPPGPNGTTVLGPLVVTGEHYPTQVKIPELLHGELKEARQKLQAAILRPVYAPGKYFEQDIVTSQVPSAGWSPLVREVRMSLEVPVPDVARRLYPKAVEALHVWDLKAAQPVNGHERHGCIGQDPAPHSKSRPSTLPHGSVVQLKIGVIVPNVVGKPLSEGLNLLTSDSFQATYRKGAGRSARIAAQRPAAGPANKPVIVPLGTPIALDLAVSVPNLEGLAVEKARHTLAEYGLKTIVPNQFARESDTVRAQSPREGTLVPDGSEVSLVRVVTRLPSVIESTLGVAYSTLHDDEQFAVEFDTDLIKSDRVTDQRPRAGSEVERGTKVQLSVVVAVPDLLEATTNHADTLARDSGLRVHFAIEPQANDVVFSQDLRPGTKVKPRTLLTLIPGTETPNLVRLTPAQANEELRRVGLDGTIASVKDLETENVEEAGAQIIHSQDPLPDTLVARGSGTVRVHVLRAQYIPRVTMVNLVGSTTDAARGWLTEVGLRGIEVGQTEVELTTNGHLHGRKLITAQNVPAGQRIRQGSVVQLRAKQFVFRPPLQESPPPRPNDSLFSVERPRNPAFNQGGMF